MSISEQEKLIKSLQDAIQMEVEGKAFYEKASQSWSNKAGQLLLHQLALDEDSHRQLFEAIYDKLRRQEFWPVLDIKPSWVPSKNVFSNPQELTTKKQHSNSEVEAIYKALELEEKSYTFYDAQAKNAASKIEKQFFASIASQERGHRLALLDYLEYLQSPETYFARTERHSLDGG